MTQLVRFAFATPHKLSQLIEEVEELICFGAVVLSDGWLVESVQNAAFHLHVSLDIQVGRFGALVAQPKCNQCYIDASLQQMHGCRVPQGVWGDILRPQRRALIRGSLGLAPGKSSYMGSPALVKSAMATPGPAGMHAWSHSSWNTAACRWNASRRSAAENSARSRLLTQAQRRSLAEEIARKQPFDLPKRIEMADFAPAKRPKRAPNRARQNIHRVLEG